jgi:hypothetical protein
MRSVGDSRDQAWIDHCGAESEKQAADQPKLELAGRRRQKQTRRLDHMPATIRPLRRLGRLAERNVAEVERLMCGYFHDRDGMEPVSREELLQRMRAGTVTVLDVRPEDEFALGSDGSLTGLLAGIAAPVELVTETAEKAVTTPWVYQSLSSCTGPLTVNPTSRDRVVQERMRERGRRGKRDSQCHRKEKLQETLHWRPPQ